MERVDLAGMGTFGGAFRILIVGLCSVACVFSGLARNKKTADRLYLDSRDVLQIQIEVQKDLQLELSDSLTADSVQDWKERLLLSVLVPTVEQSRLPMACEILKRRAKPKKGEPILRLTALRWEQGVMGEIEAVLQADLIAYGYRYRLGTFRNTDHLGIANTTELLERGYRRPMQKSLNEAFFELMPSFEEPPAPAESEG